jgi:hypothetical protein
MEVEPPQQNLVRRQPQELFQSLSILQQSVKFGMNLDIDLAQKTSPDDLPDQTQDQVFPSLRDILRTDVNDGTSDTLRRGDDDVVVLGDLEGVEFTLRGGFVENSVVDRVRYRVVDQFTENQSVWIKGSNMLTMARRKEVQ